MDGSAVGRVGVVWNVRSICIMTVKQSLDIRGTITQCSVETLKQKGLGIKL